MPELFQTICPIIGLSFNCFFQIVFCRFIKSLGLLNSVFAGYFIGLGTVVSGLVASSLFLSTGIADLIGQVALNVISYTMLSYSYFHFINLGETARRVRIIREVWEAGNRMSADDLLKVYNAAEIIDIRIKRMVKKRQLKIIDNRYFIEKKEILRMAKILVWAKQLLLGRKSEFESRP